MQGSGNPDFTKVKDPSLIDEGDLDFELLTATFWYHHGYCAPGDEQCMDIAGRPFVKKVWRYQYHPKGRPKFETEISDGVLVFEPARRHGGRRSPSFHWKMA